MLDSDIGGIGYSDMMKQLDNRSSKLHFVQATERIQERLQSLIGYCPKSF